MARPSRTHAVELTPLRTPPLKERVVHELVRLIDEGALEPGERIPTERELSDRLQVSRSTVREAVQFLQALGVVETRHGSGTYVAARGSRSNELRREWRRWTRNHAGRVHDLLEVRQGIESFAAELAARRVAAGAAASGPLESMAAALASMADAGRSGDVPALVRADMLFHAAMCDASGNAVLAGLVELLGRDLVRERAATWDLDGRPRRSLAEHREIYEAVAAGDPERARAALLDHLRSVEEDIAGTLLQPDSAFDSATER
ncbi:MAG TPA: FadR/GntR family transcriptional regulator [Gaiellaceae bacterium]|nr:FadR/GntR family transcriptional regulator [Gaiellaceae bacterium]